MVESVGTWWSGCEEVSRWLGDTERDMVTHRPLASSLDIIEKQKTSVQVCEGSGSQSERGFYSRAGNYSEGGIYSRG